MANSVFEQGKAFKVERVGCMKVRDAQRGAGMRVRVRACAGHRTRMCVVVFIFVCVRSRARVCAYRL